MLKDVLTENTIVIFDTEFTSWEGSAERNWSLESENREVIQIGATKIQINEGFKRIEDFEVFVRPTINPRLSNYIVKLTGISQKQVDMNGVSFSSALKQFLQFIGDSPINILSNGGDEEIIEENCALNGIGYPSLFKDSIDLKPFFSKILGISENECISSMLPELFGLTNLGSQHNALEDSKAILQILSYLNEKKIIEI